MGVNLIICQRKMIGIKILQKECWWAVAKNGLSISYDKKQDAFHFESGGYEFMPHASSSAFKKASKEIEDNKYYDLYKENMKLESKISYLESLISIIKFDNKDYLEE